MINSNSHTISYCFGVNAAYCSNFGHLDFWALFGGLGTMHDVHFGLIGKHLVDFLLVIIALCSLGVTAEALRAKIDRKWAFWKQVGQYAPSFHKVADIPTSHFCTDSYALQLCCWQFSHKETFLQTFFKRSAILHWKQLFCIFEPPLRGLGTT